MRLFAALYPPPQIAEQMLALVAEVECTGGLPEHRVTPVSQVHMTLQFIGERREQDVDGVIESLQRSASGIGAFTLTPARLIALPEQGPARLIALQTDAPPPLLELQRRLATRLARKTRKQAGDRFVPHFTIARFREEAGSFSLNASLDAGSNAIAFEVREIALMRSVLHSAGAEHRNLDRIGLK